MVTVECGVEWRVADGSDVEAGGNLTAAVLPTLQRFSATRSSSSRPAGNLVSLVLRRNEIGILQSSLISHFHFTARRVQ